MLKKIMGTDAGALMDAILDPLSANIRSGSLHMGAAEGLEEKVSHLCVMAVNMWCISNIPEEAPTCAWIRQYLSHDVNMYRAWSPADLVWAVYYYFIWKPPCFTAAGLQEALEDFADVAGFQAPEGGSLPWPAATYRSLGLVDLAVVEEELNPSAMWISAGDGDLCTLGKLLQKSWFNLEEKGKVGRVRVLERVDGCKVDFLARPFEYNCSCVMQGGSTPLINAASNGHTECVSLLIEKGANKEASDNVGRKNKGERRPCTP